ncbi:MAG TPA: DUF1343 domain-containing protein [Bacteroidales bacterium]|jgi:uncharacterized protein YbbC (DUF1343 family)|nr:MAG: hypothetical protein BWX96_00293 [Bacteroidetes bacterium ADurb.Bin145]HOU02161.1 DUF1343 domain-containing protein [Bacteroidales bacterium]HQG63753.1 DUF1343 domain-containing protein [Bacteroidales bacterium]HQK67533.1 DUF1343 domain-containing protein [Bacteroidales bacterium]
MVITGLEILTRDFPDKLKGRRIGVLCHAPSITRHFLHITDILYRTAKIRFSAVFGPQHGIFGQTQDNMIEWEGSMHPRFGIPVFSLYGQHRKPTPEMLSEIDVLLIDLQDIGARLYTYIWTVKLCLEACAEQNIPVWILDRPNPIGKLPFDGPVLKEEYFTFVGGAKIPLCHRMTIGEMALWIRDKYHPDCELNIIWMEGWHRSSLFHETGLPWVLPSPNMPTLQTAVVYPGIVLAEGLNLSEGRGTTIPFELTGAPYIDPYRLKDNLDRRKIEGCVFRVHNFIPAFNKYKDEHCNGIQIHVTDPARYYPVRTALELFDAIIETSPEGSLQFNLPPYEYEDNLMPFDILSGDSIMRQTLLNRLSLKEETERWKSEIDEFLREFRQISVYPD